MPSRTEVLQSDFTAGIRRSRARDDLGRSQGANVLWDTRDYIIGRLGVPLGKRGGWEYQGTAPDDEEFSVTRGSILSMDNSPFNGGNYMRGLDSNLNFWVSTGPSFSAWLIERDFDNNTIQYVATGPSKQNGVFIADNLFYPSSDGTVYGSTHNEIYGKDWNMAGAAGEEVIYLAAHLNRLVGLDANENIWFGNPAIDLLNWDVDAKYDLGQPGRGLVGLGKELLVFFDGAIKKVRGSIPAGYGITQDDISIELFSGDIGLVDAYSIVHWNTNAIWVDYNGVWMTDGATYPLDLAWAGGASDLFLDFMRSYVDRDTTRVAAGIYSNMLVISMTDIVTDTHIDTLICDLNKRTWSRQQNMPFTCFVRGSLNTSETWAGIGTSTTARVAKISPILLPTADNTADGDGTVVEPSFQTAYYRFGAQDSRIHRLFLGYEIDTIGDAIAAEGTDDDITYTAVTPGEAGNSIGISINSFTSNSPFWGTIIPANDPDDPSPFWRIFVEPGVTTKLDVVTLVNADPDASLIFTASVPVPDELETFVADLAPSLMLTGGQDYTEITLDVEYTTDPRADPVFEGTYSLEPRDIHGVKDEGYHWKPVKVREQTPGVAVKVTQAGPSAKTSIHSLGIETQPHPPYSQR